MLQQIDGQPVRAWRVHSNGQEYGPYSREEVEEYMASGQIAAGAMLLGPGMTEWQPVGGAQPQQQDQVASTPVVQQVVQYVYPPPTGDRHAPSYTGISVGSTALTVVGIISIIGGIVATIDGIVVASRPKAFFGEAAVFGGTVVGITLVLYGILMIFFASLGVAVRDMARNSFRR